MKRRRAKWKLPALALAGGAKQFSGKVKAALRVIRLIQAVLGHHKLDTTAGYTRVATGRIAAIQSPIGKIEAPLLKKRARQKR